MAERIRVLFVCAMNRWRSPTAEALYRRDPRLDVRSGGVRPGARRPVAARDLSWADVVFVMETQHRAELRTRFHFMELPPITVLEIPDDYRLMDPELQRLLRAVLDPELELLCARRSVRRAGGQDSR